MKLQLSKALQAFVCFPRVFLLRGVVIPIAASILFSQVDYSLRASEVNGPPATRNEEVKAELYFYLSYQAASSGTSAATTTHSLRSWNPETNSFEIHDVTVPYFSQSVSGGSWYESPLRKPDEDLTVNRLYKTPRLNLDNISAYKIHHVLPDGFELYSRPLNSTGPYRPGSIIEPSTEYPVYEVVVIKVSEPGALPGKVTALNSADGEMRLALGFLANGKSAGFLDFKYDPHYRPSMDTFLRADFGRPVGAGDLRAFSLSNEVEVVGLSIPPFQNGTLYQNSVRGVRQVIAPQAIVDVVREGYDTVIKFYKRDQGVTRSTTEYNPFVGASVTYTGPAPYTTFDGAPFVTYKIVWNGGAMEDTSRSGYNGCIWATIDVTRTEGDNVKTSNLMARDYFSTTPEGQGTIDCPDCFIGTQDCSNEHCVDGRVTRYDCGNCEDGTMDCPACDGTGDPCTTCNGDATLPCDVPECVDGEIIDGPELECDVCNGDGDEPCETCEGDSTIWGDYPGSISSSAPKLRYLAVDGFGSKFATTSVTSSSGRPFPEGDLPSGWAYGGANSVDTDTVTESSAALSTRFYEGAFPKFDRDMSLRRENSQFIFDFAHTVGTQKLTKVTDGNQAIQTEFGYYRFDRRTYPALHDTHHGRMQWRLDGDGGWTLFDYSPTAESLNRVTRLITPYLDEAIPANYALPSGSAALGYRIVNTAYTYNWDGAKHLPEEVITTANNVQVGRTRYEYVAGPVTNGEPIWISKSWVYPRASAQDSEALYSISTVYQGVNVSDWLRGMPYSVQGTDGSKETAAYHRGSYNGGTKTFTIDSNSSGLRSVVLKGSANSGSGGTLLTSYEGTTIDPIYMIPNVSVAEVTIRNDRAFTVRSETLLYSGSGWALIDSSDMEYDIAGNLIRRQKLNGALYEADYTNVNGSSESFGSIVFTNGGTRMGQKEYERDEQGLITKFLYDSKGRVDRTIRLALPAGVPAITTWFTYDDENRVLSTIVGSSRTDPNSIAAVKTYDKSGRVLTETSQGLTTSYSYEVNSDRKLVRTTVTLPGGGTRIAENYLDGRPKSITGTATVAQYFEYGIENGQETVKTYIGTNNGPRWAKSFSDWAGRTVRTENSSTGGTLVSTSEYNSVGQLSKSQTDSLAPSLYFYDGNAVMNHYGQDVDGNNSLGLSDRVHKFSYGYRHDGNVWSRYGGDMASWWNYSETLAFPDGETTGQQLTRTWSRVTDFDKVSRPPGIVGVAIAESVAADVHGNRAVTQTFLDRASGTITSVVYSPFAVQPSITVAVAGQVVSQTSSAGVQTSYVYDGFGRAIKTIDRTTGSFSGNNVAYYPGTTRIQSITDNRGVRQHYYNYDAAGRMVRDETPKVNASGVTIGYNSSYFAYNTRGQLTHVWGDVPYAVKYEFDSTYGDRTGMFTYRATGVSWSDANLAASGWPADTSGDKTTFVYHAANGLLNQKFDALGRAVTYQYNVRGQLTSRQWSRGTITSYTYYSATGELQQASYNDGSTPPLSYTYDRIGRIKTVQDAAGDRTFTYRTADLKPEAELLGRNGGSTTNHLLGTDRQLTYQYHPTTGRFMGVDLTRGSTSEYAISYGYDRVSGRLHSITSGAGVFTYRYVPNSNLIAGVDRGSYAQNRTYEANRNALDTLATSTQAGTIAGYDYASDDLGRRMSVDQSGSIYSSYVTGGEVMQTAYGYNDRNEVISAATKAGSTTLAGRSFGYAFDPIGNRLQESIDGQGHSYSSNALNQYTGRATPSYLAVSGTANRSGGASLSVDGNTVTNWKNNYFHIGISKAQPGAAYFQSINFAASGGAATQNETVGSMARPVNESFSYDLDGNLTGDSLWVYTYDGENRLSSMRSRVVDATSEKIAVLFAYDYMGRRVSKDVLSYAGTPEAPTSFTRRNKIYFAYQSWTLVAEFDANANGVITNIRRRFTYGIDLSGGLGGAGDIGGLLAIEDLRTSYSGSYLPAHDGNGNLTALVDARSGTVAATYEYDPFGNVLRASGSYGKENSLRFAGKYYDAETGLSFYGFRYYIAALGRFVNRDPLEEKGGWNLYSGLKAAASDPFAMATGVDGPSWSFAWGQNQDRRLANVSLPHTTTPVTFGSKKNSGLPSASEGGKHYSVNATGHYSESGPTNDTDREPLGGLPQCGANIDTNVYIYAGNNPINLIDPMGLAGMGEKKSSDYDGRAKSPRQTEVDSISRVLENIPSADQAPSFSDHDVARSLEAREGTWKSLLHVAFTHPLPRKLVDNYLEQHGLPVELSESEMGELGATIDLNDSKIFEQQLMLVKSGAIGAEGKNIRFDYSTAAKNKSHGAQLNGTLASFTVNVIGNLSPDGKGGWNFAGTMFFYDKWDMDAHPAGDRPAAAEDRVTFARNRIPGAEFDVRSVSVRVLQSQGDTEATWSGRSRQVEARSHNTTLSGARPGN